jgi:hypothetical protein
VDEKSAKVIISNDFGAKKVEEIVESPKVMSYGGFGQKK